MTTSDKEQPRPQYRVLRGLSYLGQRAEAGEVRDDIPEASVPWLLKAGAIRRERASKRSER